MKRILAQQWVTNLSRALQFAQQVILILRLTLTLKVTRRAFLQMAQTCAVHYRTRHGASYHQRSPLEPPRVILPCRWNHLPPPAS